MYLSYVSDLTASIYPFFPSRTGILKITYNSDALKFLQTPFLFIEDKYFQFLVQILKIVLKIK